MRKNQKKTGLWVIALLLGSTMGLADNAHAETFSMPFFNNGNNGNGFSMPFFNNNSNRYYGPGPYGPGPYGYGPRPYGYGPRPYGYGPGPYNYRPRGFGPVSSVSSGKNTLPEQSTSTEPDLMISNRSLKPQSEKKSQP